MRSDEFCASSYVLLAHIGVVSSFIERGSAGSSNIVHSTRSKVYYDLQLEVTPDIRGRGKKERKERKRIHV